MANKYWVGGTGTWDASTTHWSLSSGGAGGAAIPGSADSVYFDSASGGGTITVGSQSMSGSLIDFTGFTGVFSGTLNFGGTAAMSIRSGGYAGLANLYHNGSSTLTLLDALSMSGLLTVGNGTFVTNNMPLTAGRAEFGPGNVDLGTSLITLTGTGTVLNRNGGLWANAAGQIVKFTGTGAPRLWTNANRNYFSSQMWIVASSSSVFTMTGASGGINLKMTGAGSVIFPSATTNTINGLEIIGNGAGSDLIEMSASTAGSASTFALTGSVTKAEFASIKDNTLTGGPVDVKGGVLISNTSGWTVSAPPVTATDTRVLIMV